MCQTCRIFLWNSCIQIFVSSEFDLSTLVWHKNVSIISCTKRGFGGPSPHVNHGTDPPFMGDFEKTLSPQLGKSIISQQVSHSSLKFVQAQIDDMLVYIWNSYGGFLGQHNCDSEFWVMKVKVDNQSYWKDNHHKFLDYTQTRIQTYRCNVHNRTRNGMRTLTTL